MSHAQAAVSPTSASSAQEPTHTLFYFENAAPAAVDAEKSTPASNDAVHEYTPALSNPSIAIIVDNGSCWCRVGWSCESTPRLTFRNVLAKPKASKGEQSVVSVGNAIQNLDAMRSYLKSPFDRNVVTNFDQEEQIFDYIFNRLGINTAGGVNHPIVISECVWNPVYSRKCMSEMLFNAYRVPSVCYTVDSLGAMYNYSNGEDKKNKLQARESESHAIGSKLHASEVQTCLIVSIGSNNTHIIPIISGKTQWDDVRRITLGGSNLVYYMQRLLQLKYPHHWSSISLLRAEKLVHKFGYFADDYLDELRRWRENPTHAENGTIIAQLPFSAVKQLDQTATKKDSEERRKKNADRLREMARQNRLQRVQESETQLRDLNYAVKIFTECRDEVIDENLLTEDAEHEKRPVNDDDETRQEKLSQAKQILYNYDLASQADLDAQIKRLETNLKRIRDKLAAAAANGPTEKELKKASKIESPPESEAERVAWLEQKRHQRTDLLDRREKRRARRQQISTRGSYAAQQRMKIITQLASNKKAKLNPSASAAGGADATNSTTADDGFGRNDSDWAVYREINLDAGDSESEEEREQLSKIEDSLYEFDEEFRRQQKDGFVDENSAEFYQLKVGVERVRCTEILFQPSIVGIDQRGVCEAIQFVIGRYDAEVQAKLAENVLVSGSATAVPGLCERIERELISWRPFESNVSVKLMPHCMENDDAGCGGALDAWKGMAKWVRDENLTKVDENGHAALITRQNFDEFGSDFMVEHALSNKNVRRKEKNAAEN